jgi:hypothetical protein
MKEKNITMMSSQINIYIINNLIKYMLSIQSHVERKKTYDDVVPALLLRFQVHPAGVNKCTVARR